MSITQKSPWAKRELLQTYSKGGNSRHTKGEKPQHTPVCEDFENKYNAEVTLQNKSDYFGAILYNTPATTANNKLGNHKAK